MFYGDWSSFDQLTDGTRNRVSNFDQEKAEPPPPQEPAIDDHLANILTALSGFAYLARNNAGDPANRDHYLELIIELADRATKLYHEYYILRLEGGIEPELIGPFPNETARDEQAIALRNNKEDVPGRRRSRIKPPHRGLRHLLRIVKQETCQLLTPIDDPEIAVACLRNDNYAAQQKFDGKRILLSVDRSGEFSCDHRTK